MRSCAEAGWGGCEAEPEVDCSEEEFPCSSLVGLWFEDIVRVICDDKKDDNKLDVI